MLAASVGARRNFFGERSGRPVNSRPHPEDWGLFREVAISHPHPVSVPVDYGPYGGEKGCIGQIMSFFSGERGKSPEGAPVEAGFFSK